MEKNDDLIGNMVCYAGGCLKSGEIRVSFTVRAVHGFETMVPWFGMALLDGTVSVQDRLS